MKVVRSADKEERCCDTSLSKFNTPIYTRVLKGRLIVHHVSNKIRRGKHHHCVRRLVYQVVHLPGSMPRCLRIAESPSPRKVEVCTIMLGFTTTRCPLWCCGCIGALTDRVRAERLWCDNRRVNQLESSQTTYTVRVRIR